MKQIQPLLDKIEGENEAFAKLTRPQKRVVIAQDCIDRINAQQLKPAREGFILDTDAVKLQSQNCSLKDAINNMPICTVCAKGGLFLSYVGRANKMHTYDVTYSNHREDNGHKKLLEIFTLPQLALIEYAFESEQYLFTNEKGRPIEIDFSQRELCKINFYRPYPPNERLIAICENIIKNKGTFKP